MQTHIYSIRLIGQEDGKYRVVLRAVKAGYPVNIPELRVPIKFKLRHGKPYYCFDFSQAFTVHGRSYGEEYKLRDKQRVVLSELEREAQSSIRDLIKKGDFDIEKRVLVKAQFSLGEPFPRTFGFAPENPALKESDLED